MPNHVACVFCGSTQCSCFDTDEEYVSERNKTMAFGKPTDEQLANRFCHHAPFGDQAERYVKIREAALAFAKVVRDLTPCSPEQTRSLNEIHTSMMLANSAIAVNEKPEGA